jgi:acetylornithine deacetylase/succinyl-diaminopimelate desuccinylase-like protein
MTEQLVQLLSDLVALESVNPAYPGGGRGEAAVADYVEEYCRRLGLVVTRQPVLAGRDNILAELPVRGARQTLLFEAHMDTVDLGPMGAQALRPERRDGRLYGRGSCDTKGSLAAMMLALAALQATRERLRVNVMLLASVDEEHGFSGVTAFVASKFPVHAAVVGEPTELRIVVAHKGCVRWRLSTVGRAAHSSRPEEGDNAIEQMAEVVQALRAFQTRLRARRHPLVGAPTMSVGRIWGGTGVNTVPARCTIEIDRRLIPGEDAPGALAEVDAFLAAYSAAHPGLKISREEPFVADWPLETPDQAAVVSAGRAACTDLGLLAQPIGVPYGTDASKLWALGGIPAIVLGPGSIAQAHTAEEYVALAEVAAAAQLYQRLALHLTGR